MVKLTQTIRQKPKNCLSVIDDFVGMALKGLITEHPLIHFMSLVLSYST